MQTRHFVCAVRIRYHKVLIEIAFDAWKLYAKSKFPLKKATRRAFGPSIARLTLNRCETAYLRGLCHVLSVLASRCYLKQTLIVSIPKSLHCGFVISVSSMWTKFSFLLSVAFFTSPDYRTWPTNFHRQAKRNRSRKYLIDVYQSTLFFWKNPSVWRVYQWFLNFVLCSL